MSVLLSFKKLSHFQWIAAWASVALSGCLGDAPRLVLGDEAGTDATISPAMPSSGDSGPSEADTQPAEPLDARSHPDSTVDGEAGAATTDAPADQSSVDVAAPDAMPTGGGVACTAGGGCMPNDCQNGLWACMDGGRVCQETAALDAGTPCTSAGDDAGAQVCNAGQCTACNAGGDCSDPSTPCVKKSYNCSSGTPQCITVGNVPDGTMCNGTQYCNGGICTACQVGAACPPSANGCHVGKITACTNGVATCTDQGMSASAGTSCTTTGGASGVCDGAGTCAACSPGAQCNPNGNPCQVGTQTCATGAQCTNPSNVGEGQPCGSTGQICHNGSCLACDGTSCAAGCCDSTGCVTSGQTTSKCGTGAAGGACTSCTAPSAGTGSAVCANNACGLSCGSPTPNLCGTACVNCTGGQVCVAGSGQCACPSGTLDCGGTCQSPATSNSCGTSCSAGCAGPTNGSTGAAACNGSSCTLSCNAGTPTDCSGACVDLQTDPGHCGTCTNVCPGSPATCHQPYTCSSGACISPTSSDGTSCGSNQVCSGGGCVACTQNMSCTPANHCHTGTMSCSNGPVCSDNGGQQPNNTACGGSNMSCQGGTCVCNANDSPCGANCYDLTSDNSNCGSCGHVCPTLAAPNQGCTCSSSSCVGYVGGHSTAFGSAPLLDNVTVYAIRVALQQSVQLTALGAYVTGTNGSAGMVLGLYSDNGSAPGSLLASATTTVTTVGTFELPVSMSLSATNYWVALSWNYASGSQANVQLTSNVACVSASYSYNGSLPSSWPGNGSTCTPMWLYIVADF